MILDFISRQAVALVGCFPASFVLLVVLCAPQRALARPPQSTDASPAQQQPQDPAKKDAAAPTPASTAAAKSNSPKPHRVFTNDDISPRSSAPVAPGARRRLKQLNRCDRTCFNDVKKQAMNFGYLTVFPRSTRVEMDDRLANDIEDLQNDPKWQRLLLEMISADIEACSMTLKNPSPQDDSPPHIPTRAEILEEEERTRHPRPAPASNRNTASSAVLAYRFSINPDPLKASLMVHQYMDQLHQDCPVAQSTADSDDDEDP
jgi:hypothetical protein